VNRRVVGNSAEPLLRINRAKSGLLLQRKCACGQHTIAGGECDACGKQHLSLQRATQNSELGTRNSGGVPPIVHEVLRSPGQPLDAATRAFFEPRFGHDFSRIRVHTDTRAGESAQAMNALAYTVGSHVVFRDGYAPQTDAGRRLVAHELTHVLQQRSTLSLEPLRVADSQSSAEREADAHAALILSDVQPPPDTQWSPGHSGVQGDVHLKADPASQQQSPIKRLRIVFNPSKHDAPLTNPSTQSTIDVADETSQKKLGEATSDITSGLRKLYGVTGGSAFAKNAKPQMGVAATPAQLIPVFQRAAREANARAEWVFKTIMGSPPVPGETRVSPNRDTITTNTPQQLMDDPPFQQVDEALVTLMEV
jgi:hypothetical protein